MKLYHATDAAEVILANGFRGTYLCPEYPDVVWFADIPMPYGADTLCVELPDLTAIAYEVRGEGRGPGHREYVLPVELLNTLAVSVVDDDEVQERYGKWFERQQFAIGPAPVPTP